jgi:hypothetical protein
VPAEAADFNSIYEEALMNLKTRKPAVPKGSAGIVSAGEKEQAAKDYYASVRTNVRVSMVFLHLQLLMDPMTPGFVTLGAVKRTLIAHSPLYTHIFVVGPPVGWYPEWRPTFQHF